MKKLTTTIMILLVALFTVGCSESTRDDIAKELKDSYEGGYSTEANEPEEVDTVDAVDEIPMVEQLTPDAAAMFPDANVSIETGDITYKVTVSNITKEMYDEYLEACKDAGFTTDVISEYAINADDGYAMYEGNTEDRLYKITLNYIGGITDGTLSIVTTWHI